MGRELQKRKNRSSIAKVRKKPKSKKRILNNAIVAANWNKHETITQNYRRLGLATKLNSMSGGVENTTNAPLGVNPKTGMRPAKLPEARIERNPDTGEAFVVANSSRRSNPPNDPLNEFDDEWRGITEHGSGAVGASDNAVIRQLEDLAAAGGKRKAPRKQSEREVEWIKRLVSRHGDGYERMARDMKLNPMQQTAADIRRRIERWRESQRE